MFRDAEEELHRIEEELLTEEADEEQSLRFGMLDCSTPAEDAAVYSNYHKDYKAYNTDKSDVDTENYSEEVFYGKSRGNGLRFFLLLLMAAALCLMVYIRRKLGVF